MPNSYYNHSTYPAPNAPGSSAALRAELDLVTAAFNLLPTLSGNGYKVAMINSAGTALIASSALQALAITSSTLDSTPIGATTRAAGSFTNLSVNGSAGLGNAVTIGGGTINNTPIGGTTASSGAFTSVSASSGFTGNLTGNVTGDVTGNVTGNLSGNVTAGSGTSTFNNVTINGTLDMNAGTMGTITGLAMPVNDSDAANKGYVDSVAQGLDVKGSVRVATTASITLSGEQTIDGVAVIAGDRVLVKDQSTASTNGVYVVAAGAWARAVDMDVWTEFPGAFFFVEQGTANDNSGWVCTVSAGGSIGSTSVTFEQFSGAGQITAGAGMTKTGNTLNVGTASSSRIVVNADNVDLAASGVTASTYKSVTVDIYGRVTAGTNPTTLAGYGIADAYTKTEVDSILGSATAASISAAAAAASELAAGNSATAASGSASSANASASAAAASLDSFDDRYLGAKTSDPATDNDGNALITGALYFNSTTGTMRVYDGSAWAAAYLPASGYVPISGGTMTGALDINNSGGVEVLSAARLWTDSGRGRLDLWESGSQTRSLRMFNANGYGVMGMISAEDLQLLTNNTARLTLGGSGNITASTNIIIANGTDSRLNLQVSGVTEGILTASAANIRLSSANAIPITFGTNGVTRLTMTGAGFITTGVSEYVGIGAQANTNNALRIARNLENGTSAYAVLNDGTFQSGVTVNGAAFRSVARTAAAAFTMASLHHYQAVQATLGAGSAITTQAGFVADSTLVGATNNYGFQGSIAAATGRWNLYMDGTAQNFFAGNVGIGSGKSVPATALDVNGTVTATSFAGSGVSLTGVQPTLVSGTNIKTINGAPVLGSGDLVVGGGSEFDFVADGAITQGKAVILKTNGKVAQSVIAAASVGTGVNLSGNNSSAVSTCYHPVNDKFVVFYCDTSDGSKGKAVVATVSGSTVTFGTPVVFYNAAIYTGGMNNLDSCYDPVTGQMIIAFSVGGTGRLKTCTVSGTTATFGADLDTGVNGYDVGVCYDVSVSRALYAFRDGTAQKASVILVSGTSLSIVSTDTAFPVSVNGYTSSVVHCLGHGTAGTNVICFNAYGQAYITIAKINPSTFAVTFAGTQAVDNGDGYAWGKSVAWSSLYQRIVVLRGAGPSYNYVLKTLLYSVGATAFSLISEAPVNPNFFSNPSANFPSIACSVDGASLCVVFPNQGASYYGYLRFSSTFTASSLGFGTDFQFQTSDVGWTSVAYNASGKTLTGYSITSGVGKAVVATAPVADSRTSFIGFAQSTVSSGQTVTVATPMGFDANQSGLTPNTNYFLSNSDGSTLTTTVNGPRVGRALSANQLLVLGSNVYQV